MNEDTQTKTNETVYPEKTEVAPPPEEKNEVNQAEQNNDSVASQFMQLTAAVDVVIASSSVPLACYPNEDFKNKLEFFENLCSQQERLEETSDSDSDSDSDSYLSPISSITSFWGFYDGM
ncbi:uncharacterized protein BX663DRAFT_487556 [Cokeromyces recurvatus]|uniref:uncharacterized protein n=1 Tax=Cokeromyces recurvatus TaxID=90255 RepID=UPI00221F4B3C|nr:uncharacterized protein BX663DRAFT_487556 [Cokeromyces recurvatus]KAI7901395.1 hypothetical protein BX663DRAFT_487556 [Cokeromyces recurvatus]